MSGSQHRLKTIFAATSSFHLHRWQQSGADTTRISYDDSNMPLSVLELGQFHLTSPADDLKISVSSSAYFRLPRSVSALDDGAFVEALRLRDVWASRGKSCHVRIKICVDGKCLEDNRRICVLESVGYRLRNASLWNKLLLSTSLEITLNKKPNAPDILIGLNRRTSTTGEAATGEYLMDINDLRPPNSVMCCELERIDIYLDILTIRYDLMPKRVKIRHPETDSEWMLFRPSIKKDKSDALTHMDNVGSSLQGMSGCIAKVIEPAASLGNEEGLILLDNSRESQPNLAGALSISTTQPSAIKPKKTMDTRFGGKRRTFPSKVTGVVKSWLGEHADIPYPTQSESEALMKQTRLRTTQIQPLVGFMQSKSSSAVVNSEDEMLQAASDVEPEDPEMLLTPSLISRSSTVSNASLALSIFNSQKRRSPTDVLADCSADSSLVKGLIAASAMGEAALNMIASGYIGQGGKIIDTLEVRSALESPLSSLVPTMFNPGFQKFMASNSVYLSTISNAVSISWPRNAQSPSLRQKLVQLANERTSAFIQRRLEDTQEGTLERLSAVVKTRMWAMMQNHLYDRSAIRKTWDKESIERNDRSEVDDDLELLESMDTDPSQKLSIEEEDDDDDEFYDLLRDIENDDLLDYMVRDEREDLVVEQETADLLFGGVWQDGQLSMGIDGNQGDDGMLL